MIPTIIMFCKECGEPIKGQFAATCAKCISNGGAQPPQTDNTQSAVITQIAAHLDELGGNPYHWDAEDLVAELHDMARQLRAFIEKWQTLKSAVLAQQTNNSAMLKLPTLEECVKQVRHIWNEEYIPTEVSEAIEAVLDFIGRQHQQ